MSEAVPARGIVVAHGSLADGYVDAVKQITGAGEDALMALSNRGLSPETVAERIRALVGSEPTIVFTDLASGSCGFAARRLCQEYGQLVVISGVNLAILLEFIMHRDKPLSALVPLLLEKGQKSICSAAGKPVGNEEHEHRALSGR